MKVVVKPYILLSSILASLVIGAPVDPDYGYSDLEARDQVLPSQARSLRNNLGALYKRGSSDRISVNPPGWSPKSEPEVTSAVSGSSTRANQGSGQSGRRSGSRGRPASSRAGGGAAAAPGPQQAGTRKPAGRNARPGSRPAVPGAQRTASGRTGPSTDTGRPSGRGPSRGQPRSPSLRTNSQQGRGHPQGPPHSSPGAALPTRTPTGLPPLGHDFHRAAGGGYPPHPPQSYLMQGHPMHPMPWGGAMLAIPVQPAHASYHMGIPPHMLPPPHMFPQGPQPPWNAPPWYGGPAAGTHYGAPRVPPQRPPPPPPPRQQQQQQPTRIPGVPETGAARGQTRPTAGEAPPVSSPFQQQRQRKLTAPPNLRGPQGQTGLSQGLQQAAARPATAPPTIPPHLQPAQPARPAGRSVLARPTMKLSRAQIAHLTRPLTQSGAAQPNVPPRAALPASGPNRAAQSARSGGPSSRITHPSESVGSTEYASPQSGTSSMAAEQNSASHGQPTGSGQHIDNQGAASSAPQGPGTSSMANQLGRMDLDDNRGSEGGN